MSVSTSAAGVPARIRTSWRHPATALAMTYVVGPALTILCASFLLFAVLTLSPGDPVAQLLGPHASDSARAAMRVRLGLDDPLPERYWHWLTGALHGDLGTSLTYREPVSDLLAPRLLTTFVLVGMAAVLILVAGLVLGGIGGSGDCENGRADEQGRGDAHVFPLRVCSVGDLCPKPWRGRKGAKA